MPGVNPVFKDYPNPWLNVFLMMRFTRGKQHQSIVRALRAELKRYGLNLLRADQRAYFAALWDNVIAYLNACDLGVAVLDQIHDDDFNPNVSLELGYMLAQRKSVLLLREKRLRALPADIAGHLYRDFDAFRITPTIREQIRGWLVDIGIAKAPNERLLLFVSHGGTCRCAMAKVVTQHALKGRRLPFKLRVLSVAHAFGDTNVASRAARKVIKDAYRRDHLLRHKVIQRCPGLSEDADLILVMEEALLEGFPKGKTFVFNEFFGRKGAVRDPWPDGTDKKTHLRYKSCLDHLREVLDSDIARVVRYLQDTA